MERGLAVAGGGEAGVGEAVAELAVIVDFAVGDQGGRAGVEGLVAACDIDDGEAGVDQGNAADDGVAGAVRAAMGEGAGEGGEDRRVGRRGGGGQDEAGDAAHQPAAMAARA